MKLHWPSSVPGVTSSSSLLSQVLHSIPFTCKDFVSAPSCHSGLNFTSCFGGQWLFLEALGDFVSCPFQIRGYKISVYPLAHSSFPLSSKPSMMHLCVLIYTPSSNGPSPPSLLSRILVVTLGLLSYPG